MKYRWLEGQTCEELSQKIGVTVKSITRGDIVIGYEDSFGEHGEPIKMPITRRGIEIELEGETAETLSTIDKLFPNLTRKGQIKTQY